MNPDQPSREQIEARITALLLGELPADEASLLRYTMAQDPALKKLHDELQATLVLVREAEKHPGEPPVEKAAPLKLSAERREKLLAHFKTERTKGTEETQAKQGPLFWLKRITVAPRVVEVLVVVAILALLAALLLPSLATAKRKAQSISASLARQQSLEVQMKSDDKQKQKAPQAAAPANSVTLAHRQEPQLAAPPAVVPPPPASVPNTQIVLPQTEPTAEVAAQGGTTFDAGKLGVSSQQRAGSETGVPLSAAANNPNQLQLQQDKIDRGMVYHNTDTQDRREHVENRWILPGNALSDSSGSTGSVNTRNNQVIGVVNAFAGTGGGGGGGTISGVSGMLPVERPSTLALNDSGADRSAREKVPPLQPAPPPPATVAVPEGAITAALDETSVAELEAKKPERRFATGGAQTHGAAGLAGNTFYRNPAPKTEEQNAATLNGVPVAGSAAPAGVLALNELAEVPPATPAAGDTEYTIVSGDTLSKIARKDGVTLKALEDANPGVDPKKLRPGKKLNIPASTLSTIASRTPAAGNPTSGLASDSYATGVAKDDSERLRYLVTNGPQPVSGVPAYSFVSRYAFVDTNAIALNGGPHNVFSPGTAAITPDAAKALGLPKGEFPKKAEQEETIAAGFIEFEPADLNQVLDVYSKLANRTVLHGKLPQAQILLTNQTPLTKTEAIEELQSVLARNGVSLINIGDKYVKAVPSDEAGAAGQTVEQADLPLRKPAPNTPLPQPEILTRENNFSTFSLNISDVSFKFAEASLQNGKLPDTASIRSEEFINAFDYRDPEAAEGQPMAFASERVRYPFAHNRDLLRFAIKTAAAGRQEGRALNLVLLLDNSGSMERADRVAIIREALRVLATQLQPQDTVSVVTFSRTARLWADGISGDKAGETLERVSEITPEGGTNLEEALRLAYETARRHYLANGMNRVVLLTDGAANLGNVDPAALKQKVEAQRKQGIALDCFGIGWEDYNDDLLEQLSSNGDGRYAFLNSPEDVSKDFAAKLAGALQIAAADVKVQVEFNPQRVISYRQIGYATHQLTKEQFRDNTVAAGQIAAQEAGNALYTIETNPNGDGPIATVHVRYKVPGTDEYREHSWDVAYTGNAPALEQSSVAMRLAAVASAFSEWMAASPYAQEVTLDELLKYLSGVPEVYGADDRPQQLETMIREAKSLEGK